MSRCLSPNVESFDYGPEMSGFYSAEAGKACNKGLKKDLEKLTSGNVEDELKIIQFPFF